MDTEQNPKSEGKENSNGYIKVRRLYIVLGILGIILATFLITVVLIKNIYNVASPNTISKDSDEFEKLYTAFDTIQNNYYQKVDKDKLIDGAVNGMVESLDDPYSDFMTKDEAGNFHQSLSSSFEGIGAEIQQKDNQIVIVSPIKGAPAEKAGLKAGDIILKVNGKSLHGMSSSNAVLLIRGKKGTTVHLSIQRPGVEKTMEIELERDTIPINTVYTEMMANKVAKIQITSFSEDTAKELEDGLKEMEKQGMKGMVLDLRQNPGGLLDQAQAMANMFVPAGKNLFQVEDRKGNKEVAKATDEGYKVNVPVVVLIDKGSASASEILAGALSESANIPLIGETSFGKGTVQSAQDLKDGSNLKFTTAKWLTPNGNWIHKKGIKPDKQVKLPDYANLTYINPDEKLKLSSASTDVENAEKMLEAIGYNPGKIDVYFDQDTEDAVKAFQKENGLKQTGIIEGETTNRMMIKLREKLDKEDPQVEAAKKEVINKMK